MSEVQPAQGMMQQQERGLRQSQRLNAHDANDYTFQTRNTKRASVAPIFVFFLLLILVPVLIYVIVSA